MKAAGIAAAAAALPRSEPWLGTALAQGIRKPDSLPDPTRPAGEPTSALPFDHIVCLMQENHSYDNYFGMLPIRGQPQADGFTFDGRGRPVNFNPYKGGVARVQRSTSACQPTDVNQAWTPTHKEMDGGRMDGFANFVAGQMVYYDQPDIPFYYSFANAFTVGNRWFSSTPCQTYPNRRFYLAATAFGLISTDNSSVTQAPPNGTIFDRLNAHGISWKDYFVDVPGAAVILQSVQKNPLNMVPISQFFADCASGNLPSVSFVDPEIGLLNVFGSALAGLIPIGNGVANYGAAQDQDEENPADIQIGESYIESIVRAVLQSPAWPRTLIVFIYDEHGGYYDHVPPPPAIKPDSIKPVLARNDLPGGYDRYGPRVPAVVASPYAKPHGVTNVVHDHTSVLATIEAKWNLPAMTYRDANARTVADFLTSKPALLQPPALASSGDLTPGELACSTAEPTLTLLPHIGRLVVQYVGYRKKARGVVLVLYTGSGEMSGLRVQLRHRGRVVALAKVKRVSSHYKRVVLHHKGKPRRGSYSLVVRRGGRAIVRQRVHVG